MANFSKAPVFPMSQKSPGDFQWFMLQPKYWGIWLGYGFLWLIVQLPFPWIVALGKAIGRLIGKLLKSRRRIAEINIQLCFPELSEAEQRKLVDANVEEAGVSLLETGIAWFWPTSRIRMLSDIQGYEHLEQAKEQGKGVVMLSCHMMSLEIGGRIFGERYSANSIYRPNKNPVLEYFQYRGRTRAKVTLLNRNKIRTAFKALKKGERAWYAPDQDLGRKRSVFVPFFGVEDTATAPGAGPMASLGNALVIPFYQYRKADNSGYQVVIMPPLEGFPTGDEIIDTTRVNQVLEGIIRQHPEQYLWMHRRFKTRADENAPSRY